jgi:CHAT domain-containing protein
MKGNLPQAANYYRQAVSLRHEQGDISAEAEARWPLGRTLLQMGDSREALNDSRLAQTLAKQIEKDLHSPTWQAGYVLNREATIKMIEILQAAHRKEPARGYDREAFTEADQMYGQYLGAGKPFRSVVEDIQAALDQNSVVLEYWIGNEGGWIWSVTHDGFSMHDIPGYKDVETLSRRAYDALVARGDLPRESVAAMRRRVLAADQDGRDALVELSKHLLTPIGRDLRFKRLFIVGDGVIQRIPLSLLPDPSSRDNARLVDRHEVVYLPSSGVMLARNARTHGPDRKPWFTIVADPSSAGPGDMGENLQRAVRATEGDAALPRLQFAGREVRDIMRCAPSQYTRQLIGPNANRRVIMDGALGDSKFIHFIAHGFVNGQDPELSGLLLSRPPGGRQDEFLRLSDVQNLHLSADLVVLSACRTARGAEPRAGGVVSLTSGFLRAGAAAVLSTAWKVDDEATAEFMKLFYERLFGEGQSPATALQGAQLAMAADARWHAPYYWGGFLLYGNWR